MTLFGGMEEWRNEGMMERNSGIPGIFYNTEYMEYTKTRNLQNILKQNTEYSNTQSERKALRVCSRLP